jgi:hypothetical protein
VLDVDGGLPLVGRKRVRIVPQAGERHAVARAERLHDAGLGAAEPGGIDMRDAGVAALGPADRPAHGLDGREPGLARECQHAA